jgi:hypothetical protein
MKRLMVAAIAAIGLVVVAIYFVNRTTTHFTARDSVRKAEMLEASDRTVIVFHVARAMTAQGLLADEVASRNWIVVAEISPRGIDTWRLDSIPGGRAGFGIIDDKLYASSGEDPLGRPVDYHVTPDGWAVIEEPGFRARRDALNTLIREKSPEAPRRLYLGALLGEAIAAGTFRTELLNPDLEGELLIDVSLPHVQSLPRELVYGTVRFQVRIGDERHELLTVDQAELLVSRSDWDAFVRLPGTERRPRTRFW